MSYSRWSNSAWYCFHNCSSGSTKEEQVLSLWYDLGATKDWSYDDLVEFNEDTIKREYPKATPEEVAEAMGYIKDFLDDCEDIE